MDLWLVNNMNVIITVWALNCCVPFSCIDSSHTAHNRANYFKTNLFSNLWKNMFKTPLIWLIYLILLANFILFLIKFLMKWFCGFTKYTTNRTSRRVKFSYFFNTVLDHGKCPPSPWYLSEFSWIMLQYLVQTLCNI